MKSSTVQRGKAGALGKISSWCVRIPRSSGTRKDGYPGWKKLNGHYHRSSKGGGEWEFFHLPEQWTIHYKDLTFQLKPFSFKHTGLFPEQAANWDWFGEKIRNAGRPVKVLNLFAYTGGATLAAAAAGAAVTHVDASKGMVAWAKENASSSGLDRALPSAGSWMTA